MNLIKKLIFFSEAEFMDLIVFKSILEVQLRFDWIMFCFLNEWKESHNMMASIRKKSID